MTKAGLIPSLLARKIDVVTIRNYTGQDKVEGKGTALALRLPDKSLTE